MSITSIAPSDASGADYRDHATGGYDMRALERLVIEGDEFGALALLRAAIGVQEGCHDLMSRSTTCVSSAITPRRRRRLE